jgi:ATP-dependent Clp protease ATP-binding subunit ClpA
LIMTTNAGAEEMSRSSIGFSHQDHSSDGKEALKKMFTPEFRNRLDSIIQFSALSKEVVKTVVDKFLVQLQTQLDEKRVHLNVTDEARAWLAENGYDEKMGARPMARLIQEKLKKPLAEMVLFGELSNGGDVTVTVEDDDIHFEFASELETV